MKLQEALGASRLVWLIGVLAITPLVLLAGLIALTGALSAGAWRGLTGLTSPRKAPAGANSPAPVLALRLPTRPEPAPTGELPLSRAA